MHSIEKQYSWNIVLIIIITILLFVVSFNFIGFPLDMGYNKKLQCSKNSSLSDCCLIGDTFFMQAQDVIRQKLKSEAEV